MFAEVNSLINSRPLGYSSSVPNELQQLNPNHLLLGRTSPCVLQEPSILKSQETPESGLHSSRVLPSKTLDECNPYLLGSMSPPSCAVRNSTRKGRQVKVGDVVLIVDYNSPRGKWNLALVKLIYRGADVTNVLLMQQCSSEVK